MLEITAKLTETTELCIKNGVVQNNPGEIGRWYGDEITQEVDFNEVLSQIKELPNGQYKVTVVVEKI
jgi:hypothetical protein